MAAYPQYMLLPDCKCQIDSKDFVEVIDYPNMADRFVGLYLNMVKTKKWISMENCGDPTIKQWNRSFPEYAVSYRPDGDDEAKEISVRGNEELLVADIVLGSHVIIVVKKTS